LELIIIVMELFILEIGLMIYSKDMEYNLGQMDLNIKGIF